MMLTDGYLKAIISNSFTIQNVVTFVRGGVFFPHPLFVPPGNIARIITDLDSSP
ncbi:MAG: hypothetical protein ACFKPT_11530 [Gloeotrichia echinulata GP01]